MKRVNFLIALTLQLVIISSVVFGQVSNYTFTAVSGVYTPTSPGTQLIGPNEEGTASALTPIGFTFKYDGINYTTFGANAGGLIKFGGIPTYEYTNNLKTGYSRPAAAPLWDDIKTGSVTGGVFYQLTGSAPSRVLTVEWRFMKWWWSSPLDSIISFEVKLYETTNLIEFVYRQDPNPPNLGGGPTGASIGLNSTATGNGNFLSVQSAGTNPLVSSTVENDTIRQKPATGQIYRFTPPVSGISIISSEIPGNYSLGQNYPNPFNPVTNIHFALPKSGLVRLSVYDVLGREVELLVNEFKQAGSYSVDFSASKLSSGIYFYKIQSGDFSEVKKMILTK